MTAFVRAIGRYDLTAAVINSVIGSAIFGLPAVLAAATGAFSPLVVLLAAVGIALVALCFAEVGSRFREHGGVYLYTRAAFGPLVGFEVGWLLIAARALSAAANFNVFVLYISELWPDVAAGAPRATLMTGLAATVAVLNILGVRGAAWAVDLFTVAKLLPFALLVAIGLPQADGATIAGQAIADPDWTEALLLMVFAFGGFEAALLPAAEMKDPKRDVAFALLGGLAIVTLVYLLVQVVVIGILPEAAMAKAPIAAALEVLIGPVGVVVATVAVLVSVCGWATGAMLAMPRVVHAMADRGELPRSLAYVHPRFRTPVPAIVLFVAISLGLALASTFASNVTFAAIVRLVYYGLTCAALIVLRRKGGEAPGFSVPGGLVVAVLAVAFCAWLLATRSFEQAWILAALIGAGLPFFWFSRRRDSRPRARSSR